MRYLTVMPLKRFCVWVFLLAFVVRFGIVLATGQLGDLSRSEMERVALSFAAGRGLADPYYDATGPTAHVGPVYPILLGLVFAAAGSGLVGEVVKQLLACGVSALRCALVPWAADRFGFDEAVSRVAGILSVFWITALDTETKGDWEAGVAAVLLLLATVAWSRRPLAGLNDLQAGKRGLFWGVLYLLNPVYIVCAAGLAVWEGFRGRGALVLRRFVALGLGVGLLALPWVIRNWFVLGAFVPSRSNFGLELYLSFHEGARYGMLSNIRDASDPERNLHPLHSPRQSARVCELGEVRYSAELGEQALTWMKAHPMRVLELVAERGFHFWFPPGRRWWHGIVLACMTLAAFLGIAKCAKQTPGVQFMLVLLVCFPLIYYAMQWSSRYRHPIEWILVIFTAVALNETWKRFQRWSSTSR
jgi:hypothetical protein